MKFRIEHALPFALVLTGACASTEYDMPSLTYGQEAAAAEAAEETPAGDLGAQVEGELSAPAPETSEASMGADATATAEIAAEQPVVIDPSAPLAEEAHVWNSASFQREFALSFTSRTDVEPSITSLDIEDLQKFQGYLNKQRPTEAREFLEGRTTSASTAMFDYLIANLYFQEERWEEAIAAYTTATEKHPRYLNAWNNLGTTHFRMENYAEAQRCLSKSVELGGGSGNTYGMLGVAYLNGGNPISAESCLRMATILAPENDNWQIALNQAFLAQGRFTEVVALCAHLVKQDPERTELWLLQARAYLQLGKLMEAAQNFELVDRMGAASAADLALLGDIYAQDELFDLAKDGYLRALEVGGAESIDRSIQNAKVLASRGANDQAMALVAELDASFADQLQEPQALEMLRLRSRIAMAEGAGDEEARVLKEILELDPLDGQALIMLGQHATRGGEPEQAIFYFERAENIEGFEAEALVRHAQVLVAQQKFSDALPLLRRAQQIEPDESVGAYLEQIERRALGR